MRRPVHIKRSWAPDPVYNSIAVTRFINMLMQGGEKAVAQKVFYKAMEEVGTRTNDDPIKTFHAALKNTAPTLEVVARRVGGATYQIPRPVRGERRFSKAVKWLINSTRNKKGKATYLKLADELLLAANNEGEAVKKKEEVHKAAESNRAFAHFAWWGRKNRTRQ